MRKSWTGAKSPRPCMSQTVPYRLPQAPDLLVETRQESIEELCGEVQDRDRNNDDTPTVVFTSGLLRLATIQHVQISR